MPKKKIAFHLKCSAKVKQGYRCFSTPHSANNMIQCEFCKKEYSEDRIRSHVIGVHGVYVPKTIFTFSQNVKQQPSDQNSFDKQKIQKKILEPKKLQHRNISKKCQKNINSVYCKYCKNVGHFVKRCPVLAKQRCHNCNSFGHLTKSCWMFANQNSKSNWQNPCNYNSNFGSWHNQSNDHWAHDINQNFMQYPYHF